MSLPAVSPSATAKSDSQPSLIRGLSLLDSVLLLAGGIIGSSIFLTAKDIAGPLPHPLLFLLVWVMGGAISLCACVAFAELGSMFPDSGGQYVYLREAYGDLPAFLYGWMLFSVANGGSIAALSVASAAYLGGIIPFISQNHVVLSAAGIVLTRAHVVALISILGVTWINVVGLRWGTILQNLATWAKFAAMAAFVILGFAIGKGDWHHFAAPGQSVTLGLSAGQLISAFGVALIAVFWAYDGWVYITWVAGEVKQPERNLPRSLILGLLLVGVIYLAINAVYLYALPMSGIAAETAVAQSAAVSMFSGAVGRWLALMIAISCFGAMASCIMSGARVYYAMAEDGVFFHALARVHPRWHTPVASLVLQAIWAAVLALSGKYNELFTYVMFMMVLSYVLTTAALFVLRRKMPSAERPYRCAGYPWLPAIYVVLGSAWFVNALFERPKEALFGIFIVAVGVPFYFYWRRQKRAAALMEVSTAR